MSHELHFLPAGPLSLFRHLVVAAINFDIFSYIVFHVFVCFLTLRELLLQVHYDIRHWVYCSVNVL